MVCSRLPRDSNLHCLEVFVRARLVSDGEIRITQQSERRRSELDSNPTLAVLDRLCRIALDSFEASHRIEQTIIIRRQLQTFFKQPPRSPHATITHVDVAESQVEPRELFCGEIASRFCICQSIGKQLPRAR